MAFSLSKTFKGFLSTTRGWILLILLTWGVGFVCVWLKMLSQSSRGISTAWVPVWGDWSFHIAFANVFAFRPIASWFLNHPLCYGEPFSYPFMADLISGLFIRWGMGTVFAFVLPSILTSLLLCIVLFFFYQRTFKSNAFAYAALSLFLLGGGMSFYFLTWEFLTQPSFADLFISLGKGTSASASSLQRLNIVTGILLSQRSMLLGIPTTLTIIMLLNKWVTEGLASVSYSRLIILGVLSSFLLMVHVHSYLALFFFCLVRFHLSPKPFMKWLAYGLSVAIPSFFIFNWLHGGSYHTDFFQFRIGEILSSENGQLYWLLIFPLSLWAAWRTGYLKNVFTLTGGLLFLLCCTVSFQPWIWDNTKLLTWSYLFLLVPIAEYLKLLWTQKIAWKRVAVMGWVFLLVSSGALEWWRLALSDSRTHTMWKAEDIEIAEKFKKLSRPDSLVLTSDDHHHWVLGLTGRQIMLGYGGWLWSMGMEGHLRRINVIAMFSGEEKGERLLKEHGVDYVVIGPLALREFKADETYFRSRYTKVLENSKYRVYDLSQKK